MKKNIKTIVSIVALTSTLAGCDLFQPKKDPLPGKRESIIVLDNKLKVDPALAKKPVVIPAAQSMGNWDQVGAFSSHAIPPVRLKRNVSQAWRADVGEGSSSDRRLVSNLIVHGGLVYAMDAAGKVSAVSAKSGQVVWTAETSPEGQSSQALGGGIAYYAGKILATTSLGELVALDAKSGKQLMRKEIGAPMRIAPTVGGANIYAINIDNELLAINPHTGVVSWKHTGIKESTGLLGGANPAVRGDTVVAAYSSGEVYAVSTETGHPFWSDAITPSMHFDTVSSIADIRARPVMYGGDIYVVSHAGRIVAIDASSGLRRWQIDVGGIRTPAVAGDYLFAVTSQSDLVCIQRKTGKVRWAKPLPKVKDGERVRWAGPVLTQDALVLTGSNGEIIFADLQTGKVVKTIKAPDPIFMSPVVSNGTLYVFTESGEVVAYR